MSNRSNRKVRISLPRSSREVRISRWPQVRSACLAARLGDAGDRASSAPRCRSLVVSLLLWLAVSPTQGVAEPVLEPSGSSNAIQVLARDEWPSSRTGEIIRQIEPLRRTVEIYNGQREVRILIQYAAGGIGNAWAFEVKEWLIAFGVEAQHVVLQPGSVDEYSLALSVIK